MRIRLLTWNIHKCIGVDRRFDLDRVVQVIRHHQPDAVLMQEVDRGVPRSRRLNLDLEIAEAAGYPFHAWSRNHVLKNGSYGNATISHFPIRKKRNIDLTIGRKKKRGCLYTRLDLPGHYKDFHLFNWHLGLSAVERKKQVERFLHSGTLRSLRSTARVVLGGDTNDWRNLLYHLAGINQAGFAGWAEQGHRSVIPTYPSYAPVGALDKFFWHRHGLDCMHVFRSRMKLARVASDHLPLIADFELT